VSGTPRSAVAPEPRFRGAGADFSCDLVARTEARRMLWAPAVRTRTVLAGIALATTAAAAVAAIGLDRGWWTAYPGAALRHDVWGVDVSHHQGEIDWPRVAASRRLRFAYVKATEGADWIDPRFEANWREARRAGLRVGAYHYFAFCSPGAEQARHFLEVVPPAPDALPPALDLELGGQCDRAPAPDAIAREVDAWLAEVERAVGRRPMLYVTPDAYDLFLRGKDATALLWLRDLRAEPAPGPGHAWTVWQFWPRGRVDGIAGPVDLDAARAAEWVEGAPLAAPW
jgi:lysozyme